MISREDEVRKRRARSSLGGSKILNRMIPLVGILMLFLVIWAGSRLRLIYWIILSAAVASIFLFFKFRKSAMQKEKEGELEEILPKTGEEGIALQAEVFKAEEGEKTVSLSPEIFPEEKREIFPEEKPEIVPEEKKELDIQAKIPEAEEKAKTPPALPAQEMGTDLREILLKLERRMTGMEEVLSRIEEKTVHIEEILLKSEGKVDLQKIFSQWDEKVEKPA